MEYVVTVMKAKTKEPDYKGWYDRTVPSPEYYRGGEHSFDTLNEARADAIRLYKRGWHSQISEAATKNISRTAQTPIQGVGVGRRKGRYVGVSIGYIVRVRGQMRWVENETGGKVYLVNDNGTLVPKKKQSEWHPFGL